MTAPRRRTPAAVLALAALAALAGAAGCAAPAPRPAATPAAAFNGTDRAWIEINIAMDEQLRPMLELVPGRAADPAVKALADQVHGFTDTQLPTLRQLHDRAGLPAQNPHEGMVMPGLVTPADLTQAETLRGNEFDTLVGKDIRDYLAQAVNLAQSETKYGVQQQTTALAAAVLSACDPGTVLAPGIVAAGVVSPGVGPLHGAQRSAPHGLRFGAGG